MHGFTGYAHDARARTDGQRITNHVHRYTNAHVRLEINNYKLGFTACIKKRPVFAFVLSLSLISSVLTVFLVETNKEFNRIVFFLDNVKTMSLTWSLYITAVRDLSLIASMLFFTPRFFFPPRDFFVMSRLALFFLVIITSTFFFVPDIVI